MEFARPLMWNVSSTSEILLYLLIPVVLAGLVGGIVWRVRKWFLGQPEPSHAGFLSAFRQWLSGTSLFAWIRKALFQSRLSRDPFALLMHLAIFWGMVVLFLGTAVATIDQDITHLLFDFQILQGSFYQWFEFILDLFGVVLLVGVLLAGYRRVIQRPKRLALPTRPVSFWDGFPFLRILALLAITGFLVEGLRLAQGFHLEAMLAEGRNLPEENRWEAQWRLLGARHLDPSRQEAELHRILQQGEVFPAARWAPVGYTLAKLFRQASLESVQTWHRLFWWLHALLAFGFLIALPFTKAFHLISSPVNMLVKSPRPAGQLPVVQPAGVKELRDFTWRQLLQMDSCTWCGRCHDVCPAVECGFPLSPKTLVHTIDGLLLRTSVRKPKNGQPDEAPESEGSARLHGDLITAQELWSCYTCGACEAICPVEIEHPRTIVDLRRHLVDQGQVDEGLQEALMHLQRYGNSFGQSPRKRLEILQKAGIPIKDARKEDVEYLWFLGDYAAYDPRAGEATQAVARILTRMGVSFGFLIDREQNAGNDVRRVGEEGLFEMLREKNLQTLATARFQALLTTDPHSYNTLKNEYGFSSSPAAAGNGPGPESAAHPSEGKNSPLAGKPIYHATELFDRWIAEGKLPIRRKLQGTATYHDPCYLGRFNGIYDPPRRILAALGIRLVEMPRHREESFCCGAGGGKIWMKDLPGVQARPAEKRIHEAIALPGVEMLVVACPKDMVMFQDAVKTLGAENRLRIVDIAQLLDQATAPEP